MVKQQSLTLSLKHLPSLPFTIIPYSEGKDTLQQLFQLCFIKLISW
jgi:hypothetical protein